MKGIIPAYAGYLSYPETPQRQLAGPSPRWAGALWAAGGEQLRAGVRAVRASATYFTSYTFITSSP